MSEKDISEINIIYDIKRKNNIKIFGSKFVENVDKGLKTSDDYYKIPTNSKLE